MNVDALLFLGILMLGGLEALLMRIRYRDAIEELARDELVTTLETESTATTYQIT